MVAAEPPVRADARRAGRGRVARAGRDGGPDVDARRAGARARGAPGAALFICSAAATATAATSAPVAGRLSAVRERPAPTTGRPFALSARLPRS